MLHVYMYIYIYSSIRKEYRVLYMRPHATILNIVVNIYIVVSGKNIE